MAFNYYIEDVNRTINLDTGGKKKYDEDPLNRPNANFFSLVINSTHPGVIDVRRPERLQYYQNDKYGYAILKEIAILDTESGVNTLTVNFELETPPGSNTFYPADSNETIATPTKLVYSSTALKEKYIAFPLRITINTDKVADHTVYCLVRLEEIGNTII